MKRNIISSLSTKLAVLSLSIFLLGGVCSCVDTVILPDDKTVDEDFWKTKNDVSLVVNKAYQAMLNSSLIQRLIVWGDFRSDELNYVSTLSGSVRNALEEISAANIQTDNTFNDWATLYSVINYCNIVIEKAQPVMLIDPNYTQGDYITDISQMKALRSLCYFYLVRVFRDVPYTSGAYMNSSQEMMIGQTAPLSVIDSCIVSLKEAEKNALQASNYSDWRRVGYLTRDGIQAILADVYLWRASVMHSDEDYQNCIDYCNKVIAAKQAQYVLRPGEVLDEKNVYHLADYNKFYDDIFGNTGQNAYESILELQFDGSNNSNTGLCQMYFKFGSNSSSSGYLKAPLLYSAKGEIYTSNYDQRMIESIYGAGGSAESFDVRKMIAQYGRGNSTTAEANRDGSRTYDSFNQNWILYRLTDILLMKAEALVQLVGDATDDPRSQEAFSLVQAVNTRALNTKSDSLKWATYKSQDLEALVLTERARELCFEGKRWFDLLRYNYRHVDGVDYTKTFAQQAAANNGKVNFVNNYGEMMNKMIKKYPSGGAAIKAKMPTEPYLYMPILQSQIDVNKMLVQNPVYSEDNQWEKQ